jgi:peptidoglycan hydrolase CwlO-like protein
MPLKPKNLGDIVPSSGEKTYWNAFRGAPARLNFFPRKRFSTPVVLWLTRGIAAAAAIFLILGAANAPTIAPSRASGDNAAASSTDPNAERAQLESQLQQLETQIDQYQGQITTYQKQGKTLSGQISQLNAQIAKVNLQIQATQLTIKQLDQEIADTQSQITVTEGDIASEKMALGQLLQSLYQTDHTSLLQILLQNPHLSDFWANSEDLTLAQDNVRVNVERITDLMSQLQNQQQEYAASRSDVASAQAYQQAQAQEIASTKDQKNQLLTATKGQESKYQTLLTQTQQTAAQIRDRIFQLLGGGQLSFEDAYQYAKLASAPTGVPPELILAVLDRESALGQNVGKCSYKTAMSPSNIPIFLAITQTLSLDPSTMMVSCPNSDGVYGGAMGPAQFVPSTWELYADAVTGITGHNPPSPWNNADAFAATGLYLKDAMTGCKATYSKLLDQERCTAAKYYAGSRWKNYLWTYGEAVVERAQGFADDIATITG